MRAVLHLAADELYLVEPDPIDPDVLLEGFVHRGLLAAETVAAERERETDPLRRVDSLLEKNVMSAHELDAVLRGSAEDAILDLLTWQDGEFRFEEEAPFPERGGLVSRVGVDIGGMLLRAAQRLDEHNAIAEALGLEALLFLPDTMASPPVDFDGDPTPTVHTLLDGHRVIDEVAMLCGLTRFAVLRAVFACVRVGAARLPSVDELAVEAQARIESGQYKVARGLLLQWTSLEPGAIEPLQRLIDLAKLRASPEEQADAFMALGQVLLRQGQPQEAQEVFRELLTLRPGDEVALQALCKAADAAGNDDVYRRSALDLARAALDADEAERAAEILEPIVTGPDAPLAARVLRARALIRLKSPDALVAEAEAAAAAMGRRARRKEEKEAAAFFRDAIATLAPERSDLLKRFRILREGEKRPARRVALVVALLALAGSAGFVVLRETPAKLLARIEVAWQQGNEAEAVQLTAEMNDRYPDSPEAEEAFRQQLARQSQRPQPKHEKSAARIELDSLLDKALATMSDLPALEARETLAAVARQLEGEESLLREQDPTVLKLAKHFERELRKIDRELLTREDHLASARKRAGSQTTDVASLRAFIEKAQRYRQDGYREDARQTIALVNRFMALHAEDQTLSLIRRANLALERYERSITDRAADVAACRRHLALSEVEVEHDRCRTEAAVLLVNGDLEGAEAIYRRLRTMVDRLDQDPELRDLVPELRRRGILQFLIDREKEVASIRGMITSAIRAEGDDDLDTAVEIYTKLADQYYWIRFENVIELPIRIETVPAGAVVTMQGQRVGVTPLVAHYRWATQSTIQLAAPGCKSETRIVGTRRAKPVARLTVPLMPERLFTAPVDPTLQMAPIAVDQDLILAERNGRISRLSGRDGSVKWARKIDSLEGVRARPLVSGHQILVPFLDGSLSVLDVRQGEVDEVHRTGRPVGNPAELNDVVVVATLDGRVLGFRGRHRAFETKLDGRPCYGVVAAHGAAWVGFSDGRVGRIDNHGGVRLIQLEGRQDDVVGITPHADGLLVSKRDGTLHALDGKGTPLWTASEIGDIPAGPARAGAFAAVADSRGRVMLFDIGTGAMRGQVALGEEIQGDLLAFGTHLIALTKDGRLWIYDPAQERERCHADLKGAARFPPALLGGGRLAVSADGEHLTVIDVGALTR